MAYIPETNSVVAFQSNPSSLLAGVSVIGLTPVGLNVGGNPVSTSNPVAVQPPASGFLVVNTSNSSVISVQQSSVAVNIIAGSIAATFTPPANQSVSGTVGASVVGHAPVVIVGGSILTSSTPNQSVSGTLQVDVRNSVATVIIGGSIAASFTPPANQSVSGTIQVEQITNPWIITGSVQASITPAANQSVSGTVQTDVRGSVAVAIISGSVAVATGNSSVQVLNFPANQSVSGAVSISNFPTTQNVSGSVATFPQGTIITSLVSTIPSSVIVGASIFGQLPAGSAPIGSVAVLQGTNPFIITGSVQGFPTTQNVSGSVVATQGTTPWIIGSVYGNISGSVAAFITGNSSVITRWSDSSILAVPVGSIITTWQSPSIVGTYAEDAAHSASEKGLFVLGIRNDNTASLVGTNGDYSGMAVDSAGRSLIKPFSADENTFRFQTSIVSGSVTLVKASVVGKRAYITDFWFTNTGSVATLITIQDGSTSILGYTIAPAGGGSNSQGIAVPIRTALSQDLAFKMAPSQSILYATITGYEAP